MSDMPQTTPRWISRLCLIVLTIAALGLPSSAQERDRSKIPAKYRWNLADIYPTDDGWRSSKETIALELRRSFGSFSAMLNHFPEKNLKVLLDQPVESLSATSVEAALYRCQSQMLRILFGPQRLGAYRDIDGAHVKALFERLTGMADAVVLDLPSEPSETNREALLACQQVVLVTESEPSSIIAAKALVRLLRTWGLSSERLGAVLVTRAPCSLDRNIKVIEEKLMAPIIGLMRCRSTPTT